MKIFISWSGDLSHSVALLLRDWLPNVLQFVEQPYVSSKDIDKGTGWLGDISHRLQEADFGIICLTQENLSNPWIHFEAGAIANKFGGSRIPALLVDIKPTDVKPPLGQFQLTLPEHDDVLLLLTTINKAEKEKPLGEEKLKVAFEKWWEEFNVKFESVRQGSARVKKMEKRTVESMLEEVLSISRDSARKLSRVADASDMELWNHIFQPKTNKNEHDELFKSMVIKRLDDIPPR